MTASDPVVLFERATARAATLMAGVTTEQLHGPTPCADWDVQQLIDHMAEVPTTCWPRSPARHLLNSPGAASRTTPADSNSCQAVFVPRAAWTGCACRRSVSSGRSPTQSRERSWTP